MQNCPRHSELELRGPTKDLKGGPWSSRGERSAPLFVQTPKLPTKAAVRGVRSLPTAHSCSPLATLALEAAQTS
eukprot:12124310-Alexandrium_andersonii.AAC.1